MENLKGFFDLNPYNQAVAWVWFILFILFIVAMIISVCKNKNSIKRN